MHRGGSPDPTRRRCSDTAWAAGDAGPHSASAPPGLPAAGSRGQRHGLRQLRHPRHQHQPRRVSASRTPCTAAPRWHGLQYAGQMHLWHVWLHPIRAACCQDLCWAGYEEHDVFAVCTVSGPALQADPTLCQKSVKSCTLRASRSLRWSMLAGGFWRLEGAIQLTARSCGSITAQTPAPRSLLWNLCRHWW